MCANSRRQLQARTTRLRNTRSCRFFKLMRCCLVVRSCLTASCHPTSTSVFSRITCLRRPCRICMLVQHSALHASMDPCRSFLLPMRKVREQTCRDTRSSCAACVQELNALATMKHIQWRVTLANTLVFTLSSAARARHPSKDEYANALPFRD